MDNKFFEPGDVIFAEGDDSKEAYRIVKGRVLISIQTKDGPRFLSELGPNEIFGEMGMVDERPRTATATAMDEVEVEVIDEDNFFDSVLKDPDRMHPYLAAVFERLRTTDLMLRMELDKRTKAPHVVEMEPEPVVAPIPVAPEDVHSIKARLVSDCRDPRFSDREVDLELDKFPFKLGRQCDGALGTIFSNNHLNLRDEAPFRISRNHCAIERRGDKLVVRDRGSEHGTVVNGTLLSTDSGKIIQELQAGENTIRLGGPDSPHQFQLTVI